MEVTQRDITSMNWKGLVKYMMSVDILLAASGSHLLLSLFLMPKSGVVEIQPVNYQNYFYQRLSIQSDLYYQAHHNITSSIPLPRECNDSSEENETKKRCKEAILHQEVYVPPITLWMYMVDMANTVNHNKYHVFGFCVCNKKSSNTLQENREPRITNTIQTNKRKEGEC